MSNPNGAPNPTPNPGIDPALLFTMEDRLRQQQQGASALNEAAATRAAAAHEYAQGQAARAQAAAASPHAGTNGNTAANRAQTALNHADKYGAFAQAQQTSAEAAQTEADAFATVMNRLGIPTATALRNEHSKEQDARRSARIESLNDAAEMRIFGSRGRDVVNPSTGELVVNSARNEKPLPGRMDRMRSGKDARFALMSTTERDAAAQAYEADIIDMTDRGLSLSQAEVLADAKITDRAEMHTLAAKFVEEAARRDKEAKQRALAVPAGTTVGAKQAARDAELRSEGTAPADLAAAEAKAAAIYNKRQADREKMIVDNDIHSQREYQAYVGANTTGGSADKAKEWAEAAERQEAELARTKELERIKAKNDKDPANFDAFGDDKSPLVKANAAADKWIKLSVKREGQSIAKLRGRVNQKDVLAARKEFLAAEKVTDDMFRQRAIDAGYDVTEVAKFLESEQISTGFKISENRRELAIKQAAAQGNSKWAKFQNTWARWGGNATNKDRAKGDLKKTGILAAGAATIGVIAGLANRDDVNVAGVLGGALSAAVAVRKMGVILPGETVDNRTIAEKREERQNKDVNRIIREREEAQKQGKVLTTTLLEDIAANYDKVTEEAVDRDRNRFGAAILVGALAAGAAAAVSNNAGEAMGFGGDAPDAPDLQVAANADGLADGGDAAGGGMPKESEGNAIDTTDTVTKGEATIHSLQDVLKANGVELSGDQASELFDEARKDGLITGDNISKLDGMNIPGPNLGLSSTGTNQFNEGFVREMMERAAEMTKDKS
jgi:hypothetical protein